MAPNPQFLFKKSFTLNWDLLCMLNRVGFYSSILMCHAFLQSNTNKTQCSLYKVIFTEITHSLLRLVSGGFHWL